MPLHTMTAWALTYLLHSTVLLGSVWLISRHLRSHELKQLLWRVAVIAGIITATFQFLSPVGFGLEPLTMPSFASNRVEVETEIVQDSGSVTQEIKEKKTILPHLSNAFTVFWLMGVLLMGVRLVRACRHLQQLLADRRTVLDNTMLDNTVLDNTVLDNTLLARLEQLRRQAGLKRKIYLTVSSNITSPLALGHCEICLPSHVLEILDGEEQTSVLAHELAHLVRRDPFWLWMITLLETLFFFQPLNRLAHRELQCSAEFLCDAWTVDKTGSRLSLAKSLAKVAESSHMSQARLSIGFLQSKSILRQRVECILEQPHIQSSSRWFGSSLALALVLGVCLFLPGFSRPVPLIPFERMHQLEQELLSVLQHDNAAELQHFVVNNFNKTLLNELSTEQGMADFKDLQTELTSSTLEAVTVNVQDNRLTLETYSEENKRVRLDIYVARERPHAVTGLEINVYKN